jgi:hypothetical protein
VRRSIAKRQYYFEWFKTANMVQDMDVVRYGNYANGYYEEERSKKVVSKIERKS